MYEIYERILKIKGLKNVDVSRATGIAPSTLSDWKRGAKPSIEKLIKIAEYLEISLDYLLTGKDIPDFVMPNYDAREHDLIEKFGNLYPTQKDTVLKIVTELTNTREKIEFYNHAKNLENKMVEISNNCYEVKSVLDNYNISFDFTREKNGIKFYEVSEGDIYDISKLLTDVIHLIDNFGYGLK